MAAVIRSRILLPAPKPDHTGTSRDDLASLDQVILEAANLSNTTYAWTIAYKPEGSAATISGDPTSPTPGQFVVDLEGPYLIRLITDLGLPTENQQFVRLRYLTDLGSLALVAGGEQLNSTVPVPVDIDPQGWADDQNRNLLTLLGYIEKLVTSGDVFYVDPETGDYTTIQAAIDAAVLTGPTAASPALVLVRPGTYNEDLTFAPFVHVFGWPGNVSGTADLNAVEVLSASGTQHRAALTNPGDSLVIGNLTLRNYFTGANACLRQTGAGSLLVFRCHLDQQGTDASQGPAFGLLGGTAILETCSLLMTGSAGADRAAFRQLAANSTSTLNRCRVVGPSGIRLNELLLAGTTCDVRDCRIVSTGGAGAAAIFTDAEALTVEYSRIESAVADTIQVHPGAAAYAGDVALTVRWSYVSGTLDYDLTGPLSGTTTLNLGSVEYTTLNFPGGSPTTFAATTKSRSLYFDPTATLPDITADNVQEAIEQVFTYASLVRTLDDAYDGGVALSGSGRAILADQGAVQILDAASPSDPPPPANDDGRLQVVGGVEIGSIGAPEIDLDPNPFGGGAIVRLGESVIATNYPHDNAGDVWVVGNATGSPLYRNYTLRVGTLSSEGGAEIGSLILRAGDGLSNGLATPDGGSAIIQAGSGYDALAGSAGSVFIAPGDSDSGLAGATVFVRPQDATAATLTAAGAFVGGVTGGVRFATDMGAVEVLILAGDNLATVLTKLSASGQITATDSGGGVIRLTTTSKGPTATVYFLNATVGLDAALGTFDGQVPVAGTWPSYITFRVTAAQEITIGSGGITGPMVYNADTGKLTVPGVIDPTALVFENAPPFSWTAGHGTVWVADGSGGTTLGDLYYIHLFGTPAGTRINLSRGASLAGSLEVEDEGSALGRFTTMDFVGSGVTATDVGGGKVQVTVSGGGGGSIEIRDEGVSLGTFGILNFVGVDVQAFDLAGVANIYIPPPTFDSHWNTSDGGNGDQSVSESISRTSAHIATPHGGEGTPFNTGGWAATNQSASTNSLATFTTPSTTTGFGGDSTMTIVMYDADGVTPLDSYTTPAITGNGVHTSPSTRIVVTITSYAVDAFRFKAKASVVVNVAGVFTDNALDGGRYHVAARHTTDSATDGTGPYDYVQTDVFLDTNPTTPSIGGTVSMVETGGGISTKHLSGIEYYVLGSQFTATVTTIDQLNRNTSRTTQNLNVTGTEYGLTTLNHSPFGTGSGNFAGWTNDEDTDGVNYQITTWAITSSSYRYIGPTANISSFPRDPWASGGTVNSSDASVLIDTYGTTSTDLVENFDDENRRQDSTYNAGNPAGNWSSTVTLTAGHALVFGGQMMTPNQSTYIRSDGPNTPNANWTAYKPDLGGANPDYSALTVPVSHYRTIVDTTGLNRASFQIVFTGTFVADATTDLASGNLEIYIRRRASANGGNFGPATPYPLLLHGAQYNFGTFDDGVTDGHIREASSSGNTVNGTFGGFTCETGFFIEVKIVNSAIKIGSYSVTFF